MTRTTRRAALAVLSLLLTGCASTAAPSPAPLEVRPAVAAATPRVTKVLTIVLENHGTASTTAGMPLLVRQAKAYGRTTHYRAVTHPSLPNYLAMAGGSTAGVHDDASPAAHRMTGSSVFDVALAHGHTARVFAESMPHACTLTPSGRYAVKHDPWAYYADAGPRAHCRTGDVPLGTTSAGALHDDVVRGTLPDVGMVVPDLCSDAHDCPLATADTWVDHWLARLKSGPDWKAGRLAVVVTFDESETDEDNTLLTVVVTPSLRGAVSGAALTHCSWTRWMTDVVGAPPLRCGAQVTGLGRAFGL